MLFGALHRATKHLDFWDVKIIAITGFIFAIIVLRYYPELVDINPWWWASVLVLLFLRPFYHFFIRPSSK